MIKLFTKSIAATRENTKPGDKLKVIKTVIARMPKPLPDIVTQFKKGTVWTVSCVTNNHGVDVAYFEEQGCSALSDFVHVK